MQSAAIQNSKDTFYEVLRARLSAINPARTVVVRGVTRPALVVMENELLSNFTLPDCFRILWSDVAVSSQGELPLVTLTCEIGYETAGTPTNGGMDRGRALAAMDAELYAALALAPQSTPKQNYTGLANGGPVTTMRTRLWWGPLELGKTTVKIDRLARTATVAVMSYQEAGEL